MFLDYDVICYIDGASRGNPGLSGIGFVVNELKNNNNLFKFSKFIGKTTNNVAEYTALIYALEYLQKNKYERIKIFSDSKLLVEQIRGKYQVKNPGLKDLNKKAKLLISTFKQFDIEHTYRSGNKEADNLANIAIDQRERE